MKLADRLQEAAYGASTKLWDSARAVGAFAIDNRLPGCFAVKRATDRLGWMGVHAACKFERITLRTQIVWALIEASEEEFCALQAKLKEISPP